MLGDDFMDSYEDEEEEDHSLTDFEYSDALDDEDYDQDMEWEP
jgi:hypothetical protein